MTSRRFMRYYCTYFDSDYLTRGLALHQSLLAHAAPFELIVLCLDEAVEKTLRELALPHVRLLPVTELTAQYPRLAAARNDRTKLEFYFTCTAWLMRHLLPQIPAGDLLTYLDADLYFFSSPEPIFAEIGPASVAIVPQDFPPASAQGEREGKFSSCWVSLRHSATGQACAADWAEQCAAWCFLTAEPGRYADRKYLDAWDGKFPGTAHLLHPGANVSPWNVAGRAVTWDEAGLRAGGRHLIFYHFSGLTHLVGQLYDPALPLPAGGPDAVIRDHLYLPYLRQLARPAGAEADEPDILPPRRADDPRCARALGPLLERVRTAEQNRDACLQALAKNRADARRIIADVQATRIESERYTREVEVDRDQQRQAFFDTRQKLEEFHLDLVRNIAYLKKLQAEIEVHQKASVDREAYIANLNEQLARRQTGGTGPDLAELGQALEPYSRDIRRLVVAKYHPRLLPLILWFSSQGVSVEVLACPPGYKELSRGTVHFESESLPEWLGRLNSLFNDQAYLLAHPDVAAAVASGEVRSGWDHYQRFGQREGRDTGTPHFRAGLADADAVAFDSADAGPLIINLIGRLQPYHRLFISSCFNPATVWLPAETSRTIVAGDLLCCPQPPRVWLGPLVPAAFPSDHRPLSGPDEIYPATPSQPAVWPVITVVTVSLNQAEYLEETLRSVLDQNYPNLEYLVVDGGSTDGSVEIIRKYADRLAWWCSEQDGEPSRALNKGLAKSTGKILHWLNSGDRLAPGSLFTVAQHFLLHAPDMIAGRCAVVTEREPQPRHIHRNILTFGAAQLLPLPELLDLENCWLKGWFFQQPEVFFTRKILERAGGRLSENLHSAMDYDLWVRMARAGARILPLPEILALSREHPGEETDAAHLSELRTVNADHRAALAASAAKAASSQ